MSLRVIERWICDDCGDSVTVDEGDGPPDAWAKNIEDEDFCFKCAKTLDPYDPNLEH